MKRFISLFVVLALSTMMLLSSAQAATLTKKTPTTDGISSTDSGSGLNLQKMPGSDGSFSDVTSSDASQAPAALQNLSPMENGSSLFKGTPSKLSASYKFKSSVKQLSSLKYSMKDMSNTELKKYENPGASASQMSSPTNSAPVAGDNGGYAAAPQWLQLKSSNSGFKNPKAGEIYYDKTTNKAFKVIGGQTTDSKGNIQVPVTDPEMSDVFDNFKIPSQKIPLTMANIVYMNPNFEAAAAKITKQSSGLAKDETTTESKDGSVTVDLLGGADSLNLLDFLGQGKDKDSGNALSSSDSKDPGAGEDVGSDGFYSTDTSGSSGSSSSSDSSGSDSSGPGLSGSLSLTKATISIFAPTLEADVDWNLDPFDDDTASFTVNNKVVADVAIEGKFKIKEDIPILLYGYQVDVGDVAKVYIGIFLDIGMDGQIKIEVNIHQEGEVKNGIVAFGYMGIPLGATPVGYYTVDKNDVGFAVSGGLDAWIAATPQVGIEICGFKLLKIQIWVGMNANCTFEVDGGTGKPTTGDIKFAVGFEAKLEVWLIGFHFKPLDLKVKIFDADVQIGNPDPDDPDSDLSGDPPMAMQETPGLELDKKYNPTNVSIRKADAYSNVVEGSILFDGEPYKTMNDDSITITVKHSATDPTDVDTYTTGTDDNGNFSCDVPLSVNDAGVMVGLDDQNIVNRFEGSAWAKVRSPFDSMDAGADAFNSVVKGAISGSYADPDGVENSGDEILYNGPVKIAVTTKAGKVTNYSAAASKGSFSAKNIPLYDGDKVDLSIAPFDDKTEAITHEILPSLDGLDLTVKAVAVPVTTGNRPVVNVTGGIFNNGGTKIYTGKVYVAGTDGIYELSKNTAAKAAPPPKDKTLLSKLKVSSGNTIPGSTFDFGNVECPCMLIPHAYFGIYIFYNGITKSLAWYNDTTVQAPAAHSSALNPVQQYINRIINPNPVENVITPAQNSQINQNAQIHQIN